jgi:hypothetical protein
MLYFSSGSFRGSLRSGARVCPETLVSESIQVRQRKRVAAEALENLIAWLKGWSVKTGSDPRFRNLKTLKSPPGPPVIRNGQVVEKYSACVS